MPNSKPSYLPEFRREALELLKLSEKRRQPERCALWLASEITDVHKALVGTYGALHVTARLRYGRAGIRGLPTRRLPRGARLAKSNALDLVRRDFTAAVPDRLWMTDIAEHPTRERRVRPTGRSLLTLFREAVAVSIEPTDVRALRQRPAEA